MSADESSYAYGYDNAGNLTSRTDAKNVKIIYGYDDVYNLTGIWLTAVPPATADIVFGYDEWNRRTSMTDSLGSTSFGYDCNAPQ